MKPSIIITHTIALFAGWLCMVLGEQSEESTDSPIVKDPSKRSTLNRSISPKHQTHPRVILDTLASTAMESHDRRSLKRKIIEDWGNRDPMGLLDYLAIRKWPSTHWMDPQPAAAFQQLAKNQPEALLRYARENGCSKALGTLATDGNPHVVLQLFLEQKEQPIPVSYYLDLFNSGTGKDPSFYKLISRIEDKEARTMAFVGAGKTLLDINRHEDYFAFFEKHQDTVFAEQVVEDFSKSIVTDGKDVSLIAALPTEFQAQAANIVLSQTLEHDSGDDNYRMTLLDTFIDKGWAQSRLETVKKIIKLGVDTYHSDDQTDANIAKAWHAWALTVPNEPALKELQQTAIQRWIIRAPSEWKKIAQLPSQTLRDVAYTAAISSIDFEKDKATASWMINQISDERYRKAAQTAFTERQDKEDDPFSGKIDPFNPLANPDPQDDAHQE